MGEEVPAGPVVPLPLPVERRLRLGPFASARDAVKFVCYGATGALLAPFLSPYAWLPVLALGFLVSTWRPDGEALDERLLRWVDWRLRRASGGAAVTRPAEARSAAHGRFLRLAPGQYVTVLRTGGVPLAYRPPGELEQTFRAFGELLRASGGSLFVLAGTVPLSAEPLVPGAATGPGPESAARTGYRELVSVLCQRRLVRRVELALPTLEVGSEGSVRLDQRTRALEARLAVLGLTPVRLGGRVLSDAGHRFGWSGGSVGA
jgi:hypothetical protein